MNKFKDMFSTFKEDHLFWLLFLLFIFLWGISTVIFIAFCKVYALPFKDAISPYTNLLVFDATIFAPLAAYFFIDNWKEQADYNLRKDLALELWNAFDEAKIFFVYCVNNPQKYQIDLTENRILGLPEINEAEEESRYSHHREELQKWLNKSTLSVYKYAKFTQQDELLSHYTTLSLFARELSRQLSAQQYNSFIKEQEEIYIKIHLK